MQRNRTTDQVVLAVIIGLMVAVVLAASSRADSTTITIPLDTVLTRADVAAGETRTIASAPVPADLVGASCGVVVMAGNGDSVHPNSDVIVSSNGSTVVAPDVERAPGATTRADGRLDLGTTITASVRVGPDRQFSGGGSVTVTCVVESTTTTTPPTTEPTTTTTETTQPTTTVPTTETTVVTTTTTATTEPTTTTEATTTTQATTSTTGPTTTGPEQTTTTSTPPEDSGQELPRTGPNRGTIVVGLLLFGAGVAFLLVERIGFGEAQS